MVAEEGDATVPLALIERDEFRRVAALSPPWLMVAIRSHQKHDPENPPIVFPPIDHENLHIPPTPYQFHSIHAGNLQISFSDSESDSDLNSSSTFSPSDSSPPPRSPISLANPAADAAGWFGSCTGTLNSKLNALVRFLCSALTSSRGALLTFRFAAVLVAFLYFRRRRRLRGGEESRDRLIGMIKQRDEVSQGWRNQPLSLPTVRNNVYVNKNLTISSHSSLMHDREEKFNSQNLILQKISLLLEQISWMNQMLLAKQKSPTIQSNRQSRGNINIVQIVFLFISYNL